VSAHIPKIKQGAVSNVDSTFLSQRRTKSSIILSPFWPCLKVGLRNMIKEGLPLV